MNLFTFLLLGVDHLVRLGHRGKPALDHALVPEVVLPHLVRGGGLRLMKVHGLPVSPSGTVVVGLIV